MSRLLLIAALVACTAEPDEPTGCRDDGDCAGLSVCGAEGECSPVECLTSAQCTLDSYCDTTDYLCVPGCETADDCLSGFDCDEGQCVAAECSDSQIDCRIGETCNVDVGTCQADEDLCLSCSGDGRSVCTEQIGGQCWWFSSGQACLPPCSEHTDQAKLPRGFTCMDWDSSDAEEWYLFGDCSDVDAVRNPPTDSE